MISVAGAALVIAGAVAAPTAIASPPHGNLGVSFSSTPVTSAIVAHYTVTPASRSRASGGHATTNGNLDDQLPDLSPRGYIADRSAARAAVRSASPGSAAVRFQDNRVLTPPTTASFIGLQGSHITCSYFAGGCNPPDMAIAASPYFVLQGVNSSWEVLSPSGQVQSGWPVSAQSFFGAPDEFNPDGSACDPTSGNQPFMSDPRALYDPSDHRFWAAMLQVEGAFGVATKCPVKTVYYIAVSQTSDPRGAWNVYEFEMSHGTPFAADYTQIGLNDDAVFFSANMFGVRSPGFYAEIFEANKAQMERGQANFTADGFANLQGTGPGTVKAGVGPFLADTVQPVLALSQEPSWGGGHWNGRHGGEDGLFVDTVDGPDVLTGNLCSNPTTDACRGMVLWRMRDPIAHDYGGPAPSLTSSYLPGTVSFAFPPAADQPSCNACVDPNDLRIPATPVFKHGVIYTGWGTAFNNGTQTVPAIVWAQVRVEGRHNASATTGYFALPGDNAATYPAFMPTGRDRVVMLYEHMSHTTFPEAKYVVHRSDAPFTETGRVLKAGEASYRPGVCATKATPVCRWGDYEAVSFDGNGRIWLAGEYTNTHTDPNTAPWFGRNWGTWIGAIGQPSRHD